MDLGRVGLWTFALRGMEAAPRAEAAAELEALGYGAIWFPGGRPDSAFRHAHDLLAATSRMRAATGIVSIWAATASEMAAASAGLQADFGDRFVLGLGVSHPEALERQEPGRYRAPLAAMRSFLDELDDLGEKGSAPAARIVAALGPEMLRLAGQQAAGAHPYFVPVEHTAFARGVLAPNALLAPEQAVVLETDPDKARAIARTHMAIYLGLVNYTNNLRRFGFTDDDIARGGSDRLVDAIVAWGDLDAIAARVKAHHDAGADHVCLQVLGADPRAVPLDDWRRIAPAVGLG